MARIKQWVNLEPDMKYLDKECKNIEEMGRIIVLKAELDKKDANSLVILRIEEDPENVKYKFSEGGLGAHRIKRVASISEDGEAKFKVKLSAAGGDIFKFKCVDLKMNEVEHKDEFETRRRLYYQVIKMVDIEGLSDYSFLEDEFKKNKREIYLEKIHSLGKIEHVYNLSYSNRANLVRSMCKDKYNKAKDPYCFALAWVDCLARGPKEEWLKGVFNPVSSDSYVKLKVPKGTQLWKDIDVVPDNSNDWLIEALFVYTDAAGVYKIYKIPKSDVIPTSYDEVTVISDKFPKEKLGYKGPLVGVKVKLVEGFNGGFSDSKANIVAVATRGWRNKKYPQKKSETFVLHEVGHKLGLVPNDGHQGKGIVLGYGLSAQTTLDKVHDANYKKKGRAAHCNDGSCTMWWRGRQKSTFCDVCHKSLRKLNLNVNEIYGLALFHK